MMKRSILCVPMMGLAIAAQVHADEFNRETSAEVYTKTYSAMHFVDKAYEIGLSTLVIKADCAETKEAAEKAIEAKTAEIQNAVSAAFAKLSLPTKTETSGYDLTGAISSHLDNPVANVFDAKKENYFFTNRCTGEASPKPVVGVKKVHVATRTITIKMPNQGTVLNALSALVTEVEGLGRDRITVECSSGSGANYDLTVTEKTRTETLAEIKRVAQERAEAKREKDQATAKYTNVWPISESFQPHQATALPHPEVVKENGKWVAKFSTAQSFSVFFHQVSDADTSPGILLNQKSYEANAQTQSSEKLYATLQISVQQGCLKSKAEAEKSVAEVGNKILESLRAINGGLSTETDYLKVKDSFGQSYSPLQTYQQYDKTNQRQVSFYFNPCTGETFPATVEPEVEAFQGSQSLIIASSNLDALSELRDELNKQFTHEVDKADQVNVSVGWSASAAIEVLDAAAGELERAAFAEFRKGNELACDLGKSVFACISKPVRSRPEHFKARAAMAMESAPAAADGYALEARSDVSAAERGMERIQGTFLITDEVRKIIQDHRKSK